MSKWMFGLYHRPVDKVISILRECRNDIRQRYGDPIDNDWAPNPTAWAWSATVLVTVENDDGDPIACGAHARIVGSDMREVRSVYVKPAYRRQGIAKALMAQLEVVAGHLEDFDDTAGCRRLVLETGPKQPEAQALYRSMGYHEIPNYGASTGGDGSVYFEKILAAVGPDLHPWPLR